MEAAVPFESNKRKKETDSSSGSSIGNDDDDDYKLKVQKRGEEWSPSSSSDSSDHWSSASSSSDNEQVNSDSGETTDDDDVSDDETQEGSVSEELSKEVVAYYSDEARKNKDTMEVTKIREIIGHSVTPTMIYFICFDARLTAKDGKETKETNCRSVLLEDPDPEGLQVYSLKLGALEDKDIKNWFRWRPARMVVYSASLTELEPAPPKEETVSDSKEEDNNAKDEDDKARTEHKINWEKTLSGRGCTCCVAAGVRHSAKEAVAYYNKKGGLAQMKMGEIEEVFSHDVGIRVWHIKFNARLIYKDGKETERTTCQAVVSSPSFGGKKVWSFKFPSREESEVSGLNLSSSSPGNKTDEWCCKKGHCNCEIPPWEENKELLKYACPDWYLLSDDEQVEDMKMKHESLGQPPEALTRFDDLLSPDVVRESFRTERIGD